MLVQILLAIFASAAAVDPNCTTTDATGALILTPAALACADKVSKTACDQLFNAGTALTALPTAGGLESVRVTPCYQIKTPAAPSQDVKDAAIELCPKYCGFCCVTPEYSCQNAQNPRITCSTVTPDMCQSIQWREIIAQDCPNVCGFCLLGGCIDAAPDCATQATICSNPGLSTFTNTNCKRTCNQCSSSGSSTTTAFGLIGGGGCGDTNPNCATWVRNGFCTSNFYTSAQKTTTCGRSCGLCGGK